MSTFPPTLHKEERLYSKKQIDALFQGGRSHALTAFPLRAMYRIEEEGDDLSEVTLLPAHMLPAAKMLISVPKRYFKHATDRNRVKRQVREAYRRNKGIVAHHPINIAFIWLDSRHRPTAVVEQKVINLLTRIAERLEQQADQPDGGEVQP